MIIQPGRPFWAGFTAFVSNMVVLFGMNKLNISNFSIDIVHWWNAVVCSLFVGAVVYGKEKISDARETKDDK